MEEAVSAVTVTGSTDEKDVNASKKQTLDDATAADAETNEVAPVVKIEIESPVKTATIATSESKQDAIEKNSPAAAVLEGGCIEAVETVGLSANDVTKSTDVPPAPLQEQSSSAMEVEKDGGTSVVNDSAAAAKLVCEEKDHSPLSSPLPGPVFKREVFEIDSTEATAPAAERQSPSAITQQPPPSPPSMTTAPSATAVTTEVNNTSTFKVDNLSVMTRKIILVDTQYDKAKEKSGDRLTKMKSYVCGTCKWCLKPQCGVCLPCVQQAKAPYSLLWVLVNPKLQSGNNWKFICQDVQKCSAFKTLIEPNLKSSSSSADDPAETTKLGFDTPEDVNEVSKVQPLVSTLRASHPLANDISAIFSIQDLMKATQAEQRLKRANSFKSYPGRAVAARSTTVGGGGGVAMLRKPLSSADSSSSESSLGSRNGNRNNQMMPLSQQQENEDGRSVYLKKEDHAYSTPLSPSRPPSRSGVAPLAALSSSVDMFNMWEYYEKGPDSGRVKCKLCGQMRVRVISGLKYHVAAKHNVKVDLNFNAASAARAADPQDRIKPIPQKATYKRRAARSNEDSSDEFSNPESNDDEAGDGKDNDGRGTGDKSDAEEELSADDECILEASMDDLKSMQEAEISEAIRLGTLRSKVRIRPEIFSQSFQLKVGRFLSDGGSMKALSEKLDLTVDTLRMWRRAHEHKTVEDKLKLRMKSKKTDGSNSSQKSSKANKNVNICSAVPKSVNTLNQSSKTHLIKDDSSTVAGGLASSGGNAITFQFNPNNRPIPKGTPTGAGSNNPFNMPVVFPPPPTKSMSSPIPIQPKTATGTTVRQMINQNRGAGISLTFPSNTNIIAAQKPALNAGMLMPGFTTAAGTHFPYNSKPPIVSLKNFVSNNLQEKFGDDLFIIYDKGASDNSDEESDYDDDVIPKAVVQESLPFLCNYCREIFRNPEILQHHLFDCPKRKSQLTTSNAATIGSSARC